MHSTSEQLSRSWLWEALLEKFPGDDLKAQNDRIARCAQFYKEGTEDFKFLRTIAPDAFMIDRLVEIYYLLTELSPRGSTTISSMIDYVIQQTTPPFHIKPGIVFDYNYWLLRRACLDQLYDCSGVEVVDLCNQLKDQIQRARINTPSHKRG